MHPPDVSELHGRSMKPRLPLWRRYEGEVDWHGKRRWPGQKYRNSREEMLKDMRRRRGLR
jgi:hypothetical protein